MNTRVLLAAAIAAALPVLAAERVDRTQLPPAVRKTLDEATQGEPIKQITVRHATDRAVYDIELERSNAANSHVRINETGELISDTRNTPATEAPLVYPDGVPGVVALPRLRLD